METNIFETKDEMGKAAAKKAAEILRASISNKGKVTFVAATGKSQFEFLDALVKEPSIEWSKTTMFHLDEYIGIPEHHPASFGGYLKKRLINIVNPGVVNLICGDCENPQAESERLNKLIAKEGVDIAFVGMGENGHLAFNDPPADFDTEIPYIIVELDENCRKQQLGEGWFKSLDEVPRRAISMSIKQIMKSKSIICTVPDERKALAVKNCLEKEISNMYPASILRKHSNIFLYLDKNAASLLKK